MENFIIFFNKEPIYQINAYFYSVEEGFVNFYDDKDNLIGSFNTELVDFIVSEKFADNICELGLKNSEDEDEDYCDKDCEDEDEDESEDWEYKNDFDNILTKILLHGKNK